MIREFQESLIINYRIINQVIFIYKTVVNMKSFFFMPPQIKCVLCFIALLLVI